MLSALILAMRAVQTVEVSDRDQRPEGGGEGEPEDPMAHVACLECGRGDDDERLLLCDGAVPAMSRGRRHTIIAGKG